MAVFVLRLNSLKFFHDSKVFLFLARLYSRCFFLIIRLRFLLNHGWEFEDLIILVGKCLSAFDIIIHLKLVQIVSTEFVHDENLGNSNSHLRDLSGTFQSLHVCNQELSWVYVCSSGFDVIHKCRLLGEN